jgi:hypothetical protein
MMEERERIKRREDGMEGERENQEKKKHDEGKEGEP